jgi:hypothetical protein
MDDQNMRILKTHPTLSFCSARFIVAVAVIAFLQTSLPAQQISLQALVTPSTVISQNGQPVTFALHGFIEFKSLAEMFPYIEAQTRRWNLTEDERRTLARDLVRQGVESRVVSMTDERPLDTIFTHTAAELRQAIAQVKEPVPDGYAAAFLQVQQKWQHSINCWSATSSISGRVLSNWYPIEEGIQLYGDTYDSTEHFWQAVKYHPDVKIADVQELLSDLQHRDWNPWLARLEADPKIYLPNAYAIEFLRFNLSPQHLDWFAAQLKTHGLQPSEYARKAQQRGTSPFRFTASEDKALFGDLADVFHLIYHFSLQDDPVRQALADRHFDAIYLGPRRMGFISEDFRSLMLEIWHVKYLQMPRFRQVISSIPLEIHLEHFLNDGDSPDIPIPIYVGYLNQIRDLARSGLKQ